MNNRNHPPKVLVIEDDKNVALVVKAMIEKSGAQVEVILDGSKALEGILSDLSLVVTDLYMPEMSGMQVLEYCQKLDPSMPVVMMTAYGSVDLAVEAMKKGAFDFVTKPFDQSEFLAVIRKALETRKARLLDLDPAQSFSMIGQSQQVQEVFRVIQKVAESPTTILLTGESGTGKELVAFEIHKRSKRAQKAFVRVNCAAIPATLIESELFGYEKGAFTGATTSKLGRFELANEGTLFLDEVAEMPLEMQAKLLRVLQEYEFERVGGVVTQKVDVRLVAATNRDLALEVQAGRFREDLFYRLNVVPIKLPPLRERKDDIELFVKYFIETFNTKLGKKIVGYDDELLAVLKKYTWPGNVRQLENVMELMILMSDGPQLRLSDVPEEIRPGEVLHSSTSLKELVKQKTQSLEKDLIAKALSETSGNVTKTAEKLGLSRKGLQLKMKELGLRKEPS